MSGKIAIRERATGEIIMVWPVDAREILQGDLYEAADDQSAALVAGRPVFPMGPQVRTTLGTVPPNQVAETATTADSGSSATKTKKPKG